MLLPAPFPAVLYTSGSPQCCDDSSGTDHPGGLNVVAAPTTNPSNASCHSSPAHIPNTSPHPLPDHPCTSPTSSCLLPPSSLRKKHPPSSIFLCAQPCHPSLPSPHLHAPLLARLVLVSPPGSLGTPSQLSPTIPAHLHTPHLGSRCSYPSPNPSSGTGVHLLRP